MKLTLLSILALIVAMAGCTASNYAAKTSASFVRPDGTRFEYFNEKDLTGVDVTYELDEKGNVKKIHFKLEKSGTPELMMKYAAESNAANAEILKALAPFITKAASMGAGS